MHYFLILVLSTICSNAQDLSNSFDEFMKLREKHISELLLLQNDDWNNLDCPAPSKRRRKTPKSVELLTPSDIKVVGALGDSLTTAEGALAKDWSEMLIDYRNVSFSTGGAPLRETISLANILREFSPNLVGASNNPIHKIKDADDYNCAIDNSETSSLEFQAQNLVDKVNQNIDINVKKDWKFVTIFSGGNDIEESIFCTMRENSTWTRQTYYNAIKKAVKILHQLPRILVVIITVENLAVYDELNSIEYCAWHNNISEICTNPSFNFNEFAKNYSSLILDLKNFDTKRQDFAVVVQSFPLEAFRKANDGNVNLGLFSLDCLHWSGIGHSFVAKAMWHNLLAEPIQKENGISCPHPDCPYFIIGRRECAPYNLHYDWWIPTVAVVVVLIGLIFLTFACHAFCKYRTQQRLPPRPAESTPLLEKR